MKYDPTVNLGTVIQIIVVLCAAAGIYKGLSETQVEQAGRIKQIEVISTMDREATKATMLELKADVSELKKSSNDIKEGLAILRGRAAATDIGSPRR